MQHAHPLLTQHLLLLLLLLLLLSFGSTTDDVIQETWTPVVRGGGYAAAAAVAPTVAVATLRSTESRSTKAEGLLLLRITLIQFSAAASGH